ncbi:MAG TPA: aspartyl protease family protein [Candidatus Cybelea sp.]|jgi:hypothetical protein
MRPQALIFACALVSSLGFTAGPSAQAQGAESSCRPQQVLREMRSALGGAAWNEIAQTSAFGDATIAGLHGNARFDDDLLGGRYARRFDIAVMGRSAEVYDGTSAWAQDISGGVRRYDSPYARELTVTKGYLSRRGYFERNAAATIRCAGTRISAGRPQIVLRAQPNGGAGVDLAIDAQTYLLTSVTMRGPLETSVVKYSDYRTVDGVVLPFAIAGDGEDLLVTRYTLFRGARSADFARPVAPDNARMLGSEASSTVPMRLDGRQLLVWASIDGRAAMPFILDTGGHAILTTLAAKTLGLQASGAGSSGGAGPGTISTSYTRVKSIRIGQAELLDQPMLIIPYPYSFYERAKNTPVAGILGLEFFERFATRLDYGDRTVTFTKLGSFRYRGNGNAVAFTFETDPDMPMVDAAADGHPGLFGVDTGNAGHLILFGPYIDRTGLAQRYASGPLLIGHGTGGANTSYLAKLREFTIGERRLYDLAAGFTHMKSGSFATRTQAGNFGFAVLSRFIPTFDYASQMLYLDPQRRATPFWENRSGISFEKNGPHAFDVLVVQPDSPASSVGLVAGDRVVAVNGKAAEDVSYGELTHIIGAPAGTKVRLRVAHQQAARDVVLVLR